MLRAKVSQCVCQAMIIGAEVLLDHLELRHHESAPIANLMFSHALSNLTGVSTTYHTAAAFFCIPENRLVTKACN